MQKDRRVFWGVRSLSFRLYLIIVPITVLAIALLSYLDFRFSSRLLDDQVRSNTIATATQLADDLAANGAGLTIQEIGAWLDQLIEANLYIMRINVYRLSADGLTQVASTSRQAPVQAITADELTAMREGRLLVVPVFHDRERLIKVIAPFSDPATSKGCVTVVSTFAVSDLMGKAHERIALFLIPGTALLLVFLLHQLYTRGITRRIDRLVIAMSQAKSGNLQKRAAVGPKDELGIIAEGFNEMMEEIERGTRERDRLLEEQKGFNLQLQEKVREATQGLSSANEQLRQLNEDLIDTQRRLSHSERSVMVGQMAATFAHEIGSPLSAMSTHLQLLEENPGITDEARRRVRLVSEQVNRITGFVEELLTETRATMQARTPVQLNRLLQQLLLFLDQHLQKHRIQIETRFSPDLPEIEANAQQLQQVFLNLLNNACDAMHEGGVVRVATATEQCADGITWAVVSITDDGIGIPAEKQGRIFEPYFTTKDLGRGAGLGLSIAADIVRRHKGTIALDSAPGRGTTFTIRFQLGAPAGTKSDEVGAGGLKS